MNIKLNAYKSVELNSKVLSASPHELIAIVLDAILSQISIAQSALTHQDIHKKCSTITKAIELIDYLRSCLNFEAEPALSNQLNSLYEWSSKNLMNANLHNDSAMLADTYTVIHNIKKGWDGIADHPSVRYH